MKGFMKSIVALLGCTAADASNVARQQHEKNAEHRGDVDRVS